MSDLEVADGIFQPTRDICLGLGGRKIGLTLCGANVDSDVFARVLAGGSH